MSRPEAPYVDHTRRCGDGRLNKADGEDCDDGNNASRDGCDPTCEPEADFLCRGQPSICFQLTDLFTATGGVSTVDGQYDGGLGSMTCVTVNVPPATSGTGKVKSLVVSFDGAAGTVRDLTMKVVSPSGTVVTLFSLPGFSEPRDDGSFVGTSVVTLQAGTPILFADGEAVPGEAMGVNSGLVVACTGDGICDFDPHPGAAHPGKLSSFVGQRSEGAWKLCAGDSEPSGSTFTFGNANLFLRR